MTRRWVCWGLVMAAFLGQAAPAQPVLREIRKRYESRQQDVTQRLSGRRAELVDLLGQTDPDKAGVKAKLQEIMELERERQDLMVDEFFEAKTVLKPQQWEAYRRRVLKRLRNERRGR